MPGPDRHFWQDRFARHETPWDRGGPGPQLLRWLADGTLDATSLQGAPVAVPGCGSGHDVVAIARAGLPVIGLDYADGAVQRTRDALAAAGEDVQARARVEAADVLAWHPPQPLGAIYEQTCLCALHPDHWTAYAANLHAWLRPGGRLLLMAMQSPKPGAAEGRVEGPPYHVHIHAARALFPEPAWSWSAPPYPAVPHPAGFHELAVVLIRAAPVALTRAAPSSP